MFVSDARMTLVVGCMLLVATILTPLLWHLWMHAGSANANFYFAMSVLYSIAQVCTSYHTPMVGEVMMTHFMTKIGSGQYIIFPFRFY